MVVLYQGIIGIVHTNENGVRKHDRIAPAHNKVTKLNEMLKIAQADAEEAQQVASK